MDRLLITGGNSIHTYNFFKLVGDAFQDVLVITNEPNPEYRDMPCRVVDFSLRRPWLIKKSISEIRSIIRSFAPDIIHVQQAGTEAWLTLRASEGLNIPVIVTAWGSDVLVSPGRGSLYRKMLAYILKNGTAFTCDSAYVASVMQGISGREDLDIEVVNFGINIDIAELPKERLIYSNRLHKKLYNLDKLLYAFKSFTEEESNADWKLVMAGDGEQTHYLQSLASDLGIDDHVEFPGWVDKTVNSDYYSRAALYVSIPSSDATAISLLEAMAAGCVPVLSNLPANHEWVIDEYNGIIVTGLSGNILQRAVDLDQKKVAAINKEIIDKKGTREVNRKKFTDLYNKMLNRE